MNKLNIGELLQDLIPIAQEAGNKIEKIATESFEVYDKNDQSPLTKADLASHNHIKNQLMLLYPHIPILSEEGDLLSYEERKNWKEFFLIDPLDGTREFIKKNGEYTVNIALMRDNRPIAGVVHASHFQETWYAAKDQGAFKITNENKIISINTSIPTNSIKIATSKSHISEETINFVSKNFKDYELIPLGSSLKFCKIAEGSINIYPRLGPTKEWDTAASEIILNEAGGGIHQFLNDRPLEYNKENFKNPWFLAFGSPLLQLIK